MRRESRTAHHAGRSRRNRVATLLAVLALVTLPATADAQPSAQQQPATLRVAINGFENNLTPFSVTFGAFPNTADLVNLVYDTLFWSQVRDNPEPWLAVSAEPNSDFTQWTVKLRDGVTWQDGKPFTADDVKFSFDYYLGPAGLAGGRWGHHVYDTPQYASGEVLDPQTVRLTYVRPAPAFKIMPGADLPILPKHIWEGVKDPKTMTQLPVGTGPFRLVQVVPDQLYRFEANEQYFKGAPTVKRLELPVVPDPSAAFAALRTGEVGAVATEVPPQLFDQFSRNGDIKVLSSSKLTSTQLFFNARKPPLNDPRLRKAIAQAVNRQALVDTVLLGHGTAGRPTFLHPDSPFAAPPSDPNTRSDYDPAAARALLDSAGYRPGADGMRTGPDGKPLSFSVLVSSFAPEDIRAAQLIAQQVQPLGITLRVEALDAAALRARRAAQPGAVPAYDAYISSLEAHTHADPDGLYYFFHSPGKMGFGATISGYTNAAFDKLVENARTADLAQRKTMLTQAQDLLASEAPAIVLWYRNGEWAYRPAAYDGWVADPGQGVFTKRSFLPQYVSQARQSRASASQSGSQALQRSSAALWAAGGAAVLLVGLGVVWLRRRRALLADDDE